jgi:cytochrome c biogenesis protein CcmG/thiol:disulfide interchange protein DsbE
MKTHLKAIAITLGVLLIMIGVYYGTIGAKKADSIPEYTIVDTTKLVLPSTDMMSLSGKTFNLKNFAGKIIIFNFWASWCTPCIEEVPSLITLVKADPKIIIVAVSGDQNKDDILAFLKSFPDFNKPPIYVVQENAKALMEQFKVDKLPESFIFNDKGVMVKKISGTINWHTPESIEYFKSLRAQ